MSKKKKLIFGLILVILIITIPIIVLVVKFNGDDSDKLFWEYPRSGRKYINICKSDDCDVAPKAQFLKLKLKEENKSLQKYVDKINKDTDKYYDMVKKSKVDGSSCSKVKNKYNHSKTVNTHYENYENEKYISISVSRTILDLCTGTTESIKPEVYIYNKKTKKMVSQEELIKNEMVFPEQIVYGINLGIDDLNKELDEKIEKKEKYEDYLLGYAFDGSLYVYYYVPELNSYRTSTVFFNN